MSALLRAFSEIEIDQSATHLAAPVASTGLLLAARSQSSPLVVVTASSRRAAELKDELETYLGAGAIFELPPWETLPHEKLSPKNDTVAARIKVLNHLDEARVIVTSVRALIQPIAPLETPLISLEIGTETAMDKLIAHLVLLGYIRTDLVERRGDFAVRGGIFDLFLPDQDHPIRIDFFGDEIEDMSYFEVADQRTFKAVIGAIDIFPCRELLLSDSIKARAQEIADKYPSAQELLVKISEGMTPEGMESLIPLLIDETSTLIEKMPKDTQIIFVDFERIKSRAADLLATNDEFLAASWSNASYGGNIPIHDGSHTYMSWEELQENISQSGLDIQSFNPFGNDLDPDTFFLDCNPIDPLRGDIERAISELSAALESGNAVVFATHGHGMVERYAGIFRGADLPFYIVEK
jgi:transcription-repair coupling factor (superfamily II helicase)